MITLPTFTKEIRKLRNIYDYSKIKYSGKKVKKHLELIRELTFVRSISALEVFLIDNIKEIFALTKEPFKSYEGSPALKNKNILASKSLSQLHSIILNDICRKLSSGGYIEIEKFYRKYFNIDLSLVALQIKMDLSIYYEDRHLLVHKLGQTDKKYRNRYQTDIQKIKISEKYLKTAFRNFISLGKIISLEIKSKIDILDLENQEKFERRIKISILRIKKESAILQRKYCFWANDQFIDIKDVLLEFLKISENSFEIVLGGNIEEVSGVMKKIKQERKKEIINYLIKEDFTHIKNPFKIKKIHLIKDQIEEIKKRLPSQPWPKAIHKKIAKELNFSNGQVSAVIQYLIDEGVFKQQIDGEIIKEEEIKGKDEPKDTISRKGFK